MDDMETIGEQETHPSYGIIRVTNTQGGHRNLFGSPIEHQQMIALEICQASKIRSLAEDKHYARGTIIRINMSKSQFTDMICSGGDGAGTPCTIIRLQGESVEPCPEITERQDLANDFTSTMEELTDHLDKLNTISEDFLTKKSITKADREAVANSINQMTQHIRSNIPFMRDQYGEAIERTMQVAKRELEFVAKELKLPESETHAMIGESK